MSILRDAIKNLHEPEFFRNFRAQAEREAEHLPARELIYGLGIFSKPHDRTSDVLSWGEDSPAQYVFSGVSNEKGVKILRFGGAMEDKKNVALLEKYFTPETLPVLKNKYFAESLAYFTDGLMIVFEKDGTVDLSSIIEKKGADFIFIVARSGVSAKIFETTEGGAPFFGRTMFVVAEEGAQTEVVSLQNISRTSTAFQNKFSHIERGGKVLWHEFHTGGGFVKSDIEDFLAKDGAEAFQNIVSLCGAEHFDFYNVSHHLASHTISKIFSRAIVGSGGKVVYRGLIDVSKNIFGVIGTEEGRFILVSPGAEVDAIPALEAASAEGNFSHLLSLSHLRDTDFFFPALRGISPYRSQALLLSGFLLKHTREEFKERIESFVNKKLSSPVFHLE